MLIGIIGWIVIGLAIGFIVSKVLDLHGDDPRLGIAAGLGGAVLFAACYQIFSGHEVRAFNVWSMLFAAIGTGVALIAWHYLRSFYVSRAPYTRRSSY